MKNVKNCSKCNSPEMAKVDHRTGQQLDPIPIGTFSVAQVSRYVCCECGYIEDWIENIDDLKKIRNKYL